MVVVLVAVVVALASPPCYPSVALLAVAVALASPPCYPYAPSPVFNYPVFNFCKASSTVYLLVTPDVKLFSTVSFVTQFAPFHEDPSGHWRHLPLNEKKPSSHLLERTLEFTLVLLLNVLTCYSVSSEPSSPPVVVSFLLPVPVPV